MSVQHGDVGDAPVGLDRLQRDAEVGRVGRLQGVGRLAGGHLRQDRLVLHEVRVLGAPLLQHEQQARGQQHRHGGEQGDHADTALESQAGPRHAGIERARLGRHNLLGLARLIVSWSHYGPLRAFARADL